MTISIGFKRLGLALGLGLGLGLGLVRVWIAHLSSIKHTLAPTDSLAHSRRPVNVSNGLICGLL